MTRYRIPRAGGMGFDTIDTGATDAAIAALRSTVDELTARLAAVEGQPVAKSASSFEPAGAVAAHVAATDPHRFDRPVEARRGDPAPAAAGPGPRSRSTR